MSCRRSTSPKGTGFLASRAWPSPRCEQAIDAEIDAEQVLAQIERGDGGHREANRECEARVLAGVHEREAEGREAQGCHRFHGEARAPARQHRQADPPADEHRGGNCHRPPIG